MCIHFDAFKSIQMKRMHSLNRDSHTALHSIAGCRCRWTAQERKKMCLFISYFTPKSAIENNKRIWIFFISFWIKNNFKGKNMITYRSLLLNSPVNTHTHTHTPSMIRNLFHSLSHRTCTWRVKMVLIQWATTVQK